MKGPADHGLMWRRGKVHVHRRRTMHLKNMMCPKDMSDHVMVKVQPEKAVK